MDQTASGTKKQTLSTRLSLRSLLSEPIILYHPVNRMNGPKVFRRLRLFLNMFERKNCNLSWKDGTSLPADARNKTYSGPMIVSLQVRVSCSPAAGPAVQRYSGTVGRGSIPLWFRAVSRSGTLTSLNTLQRPEYLFQTALATTKKTFPTRLTLDSLMLYSHLTARIAGQSDHILKSRQMDE